MRSVVSVHTFPFQLSNQLTSDLDFLRVRRSWLQLAWDWTSRSKVRVGLIGLATMITRSVWPRFFIKGSLFSSLAHPATECRLAGYTFCFCSCQTNIISKSAGPIFAKFSGLIELWVWMISRKFVFRSTKDVAMATNFCRFRSQAAGGAAGRANIGLCPLYSLSLLLRKCIWPRPEAAVSQLIVFSSLLVRWRCLASFTS